MDCRLQGENSIKIANAFGFEPGDYDCLNYAGPPLWMTEPHEPEHKDTFMWLFEKVSINAHHVTKFGIVGHAECGGFALKGAPQVPAEEKAVIVESLHKAKAKLAKTNPQIQVKLAFVAIGPQPPKGLPEISVEIL
jgi:hypothetical protein